MRTSGLAVAFSGLTVMLSLAGLYLVDSTTVRSMAMGAIIVVAISVLGALTLLPVLMRLLGRRAYARGRVAITTALIARNWKRPPPPARLDRARQAAASRLLAGLDGPGHAPAGAGGAPQRGRAPRAGHPGPVAGVRRRRAAPVPRGQRDARGHRAGGQGAGPGLAGTGAGGRHLRERPRHLGGEPPRGGHLPARPEPRPRGGRGGGGAQIPRRALRAPGRPAAARPRELRGARSLVDRMRADHAALRASPSWRWAAQPPTSRTSRT